MGDSDRGSVLGHLIESCLDNSFAANIDRAGRFVKDKDLWLSYDGTCDGNALSLATRKLGTAIANGGIVSLSSISL